MAKRSGKKKIERDIWTSKDWTLKGGRVSRAGAGKVDINHLFKVVGEKLPYLSINKVENYVWELLDNTTPNGVYLAQDSMGCPRYIGRGAIFSRLKAHKKNYPHELTYFSFYIVQKKQHEREIETLLLRAASYLSVFNTRKVRASIERGNVLDYEVGTQFVERQVKKGRK